MPITATFNAPRRFVALCDRCRSPIAIELEAADLDTARAQLTAAGWLECALRGKGRDRWAWRCPACNPTKRRAKA